jgi:hypothetical protein
MEILIRQNIYIFWLQDMQPIIKLYLFKKKLYIYNFNLIFKKSFVDVDGHFFWGKMLEFHHEKNTQLNH